MNGRHATAPDVARIGFETSGSGEPLVRVGIAGSAAEVAQR